MQRQVPISWVLVILARAHAGMNSRQRSGAIHAEINVKGALPFEFMVVPA
jgi:hypothetical protein